MIIALYRSSHQIIATLEINHFIIISPLQDQQLLWNQRVLQHQLIRPRIQRNTADFMFNNVQEFGSAWIDASLQQKLIYLLCTMIMLELIGLWMSVYTKTVLFCIQLNSYQFYLALKMGRKPATKVEDGKVDKKDDKPVVDDDQPRTRTRARNVDASLPKDPEPAKKTKADEDAQNSMKKSKSQPKKTRSKDQGKVDIPVKDEKSKQPEKIAAKDVKEPAKEELKKVILKGNAPVDQYFTGPSTYRVYSDAANTYAKTLNQSNLAANNNKFYILQILQNETKPGDFYFFTRWGRVGVQGQRASIPYYSADVAIREFHKKLRDKLNGGYREVEMNYEDDAKKQDQQKKVQQKDKKETEEPQVKSSLLKPVQDLIRLIFDMKMMNNQMKEIGYDAKKMPLGKLAKSSILRGYEALKGLMEEIKTKKRHDQLLKLSGDFYSEIPHDFGFQKMVNFVLDTEQKVKAKLEMLQSLEDIQVFTKLLDQGKISSDMNELDSNYLKLGISITPLDKKSPQYALLLEYVENTHAATHTAYHLQVEQIFEISKELQQKRFRKDINNKQLLWHGSRLTNFVGILSQGLRIAPPEAPVTGYMFGKGVYFADMVTKSANYCFTNPTNNTGLMMLCEVALGETNDKLHADYYANLLPPGKMSTKGCGKNAPSGGKNLGDIFVPCGKGVNTNLPSSSLLYNQFIVYDLAQIRSRYLFKMIFRYGARR